MSRACSRPRYPLPCLLHVSLGLLAPGLEPEVAEEVACVISGRWPPVPPTPRVRVDQAKSACSAASPGRRGLPQPRPLPRRPGPQVLRASERTQALLRSRPVGPPGGAHSPGAGLGCFLQRDSTRAAGVAFQNVPWAGRFTKNKKTFFM